MIDTIEMIGDMVHGMTDTLLHERMNEMIDGSIHETTTKYIHLETRGGRDQIDPEMTEMMIEGIEEEVNESWIEETRKRNLQRNQCKHNLNKR